jgi:hypothetical protein
MAVNCFATALCLSWVSDAYREFDAERRVCSTLPIMHATCHRWPRCPHQIEIEAQTSQSASLLTPEEALDSTLDEEDNEDGEVLPVPMVNVTHVPDNDDNNDLLLFMEALQIAIPAPTFDDDFIPVVCRSTQARSSSNCRPRRL